MGAYWESVMEHYEFRADHLKDIKGYEYYGNMTEKIVQYGDDEVMDFFVNLQVWGTPEQCYEKTLAIRERTGSDTFVASFSYGGMPYSEAEQSMCLFAAEVMPELQELAS